MAETKVRKAGEDQLSEVEIDTLRARFAEETKDAVTLTALAEAAGLDRETVREHLRQIRTERAFQAIAAPAKSPDRPNWYWAGVGAVALVVAGGITFRRLQAKQPVEYVYATPNALSPSAVPKTPLPSTRQGRPLGNSLPHYSDGQVGRVPAGFDVVVAIPGRLQSDLGNSTKLVPGPYRKQLEMIAQAIEDLANHARAESVKFPDAAQRTEPPLMDSHQNVFTLNPGEFHYAVRGWAGRITGKLSFPIGAAEGAKIRKAVEGMLADEKAAQDLALGSTANKGIVSPPPGYRIQFGGRRIDLQDGPALAFAPVPVGLVQSRLEAALLNAVARDASVPEGRWTENAQREKKIPPPTRYAGSIEGPGGPVPFDLPAEPPSALKRGIREVAARAAGQVAAVNAQGGSVVQIQFNGTVKR